MRLVMILFVLFSSLFSLEADENVFARADTLEKVYKKTHSFDDFKEYYYELEGLGYKEKGFSKLEIFVENNKLNEEAVLFLANRHYWKQQWTKSLNVLNPLISANTKNAKIKALFKTVNNEKPKSNNTQANSSKEKAEKLYFEHKYLKSIGHYKEYFKNGVKDSNARFHYAVALEKLQKLSQSQKEYHNVVKNVDDLYELATFRYARVLMAQREPGKWDEAKEVLTDLLASLQGQASSKKRDDLIKYTKQKLKILNKPLPQPTKHKDILLNPIQKKILDQPTLDGEYVDIQGISSVKDLFSTYLASMDNSKDIETGIFGSMLNDDVLENSEFGFIVTRSDLSLELKNSTFKNTNTNRKLDSYGAKVSYDNHDDFYGSLGVDSFDGGGTKFNAQINYQKVFYNHDITYGAGYQNGIFKNGYTCMIDDNINVTTLSINDSILLDNFKHSEILMELNNFSDGNKNISSWINYPLYTHINGDFENDLSLSGNYEYNSKTDTCYWAEDFYDGNYITTKPKINFKNGSLEGMGAIGYSAQNSEALYNYGLKLELYVGSSSNIYIDCNHYQSASSPDGADECYASVSHIW